MKRIIVLTRDVHIDCDFCLDHNDVLVLNGFSFFCSGDFTLTKGCEIFRGTLLEYAKSRKGT